MPNTWKALEQRRIHTPKRVNFFLYLLTCKFQLHWPMVTFLNRMLVSATGVFR